MDSQTLLCKTACGQNEIARRELLQSRVMRNVLLLVDGKRDVRDLQQMMQALCAPPDALEQLLDLGLIAALPETAPPAPAAGEPAADAPVADAPVADEPVAPGTARCLPSSTSTPASHPRPPTARPTSPACTSSSTPWCPRIWA